MKVTIKKGKHYSTLLSHLRLFPWVVFNVKALQISVEITPSMFVYHEGDCANDSNKLFGVAPLFSSHHFESSRIVYTCHGDYIRFYGYEYAFGVLKMSVISGVFKVGETARIKYRLPNPIKCGRKLFSYHGGNCAATHDINYSMKISYL